MSSFDHLAYENANQYSIDLADGHYQTIQAMNAPLGGPMYLSNQRVARSFNPPCALTSYQGRQFEKPAYYLPQSGALPVQENYLPTRPPKALRYNVQKKSWGY